MSQEQLVAEVGDSLRFSWGWRCLCGYVIKGSQTKSAVRSHTRIQVHLRWAWTAGFHDQVCQCSVCKALIHIDNAKVHAKIHETNMCACGARVDGKSRKKHERTEDHLQWAMNAYRFDLALRCIQCAAIYHPQDKHRCGDTKSSSKSSSSSKISRQTVQSKTGIGTKTVLELKDMCRALNLTVSGLKQQLIDRIEAKTLEAKTLPN